MVALMDEPYVAVIFSSTRTVEHDAEYAETAAVMERLAARQPGHLGFESAREPASRFGVTVSYWKTEADALAWKQVVEHQAAQALGREFFYERYSVRVAVVQREYHHP